LRKIYAGVFGSGLGHITRVYSIANVVESQYEAHFLYSTFDEAFDFLKRMEKDVLLSPSVDIEWNQDGGFSGKRTVVKLPFHIRNFSSQIAFESRRISKYVPNVTITDSRLSTLIGAKANRLPAITIVNQFKILLPPRARRHKLSSVYERIGGDTLGFFWSMSDYVLFPDLPPPFTIGEANVAGSDLAKKVHFIGFISPNLESRISEKQIESVRNQLGIDSRPLVFIQISGPERTKTHFIEIALNVAKYISKEYNVVISKGVASGATLPSKLNSGVLVYEWCPVKDELFLMSDLVVARAGHTTISQCIENGKQAVLVPIYNHSEQLSNADKFVKLGLGIKIRSEELTRERLVAAVRNCTEDSSYKENALKLQRVSDRYNGIQNAVEVVKEFL